MAVGDYLKPQRSPLSVYDEQMAQMLREQSAGIGAQQIAAEAYGGKFPVGTMTAKILGGVLANAKEKSALNRDVQSQKARALYAQYLRTGKLGDKTVDADGNIMEMTEQPMFREEQVQEMVPSGTNAIGTPSLGRAPAVTVAQNQVRDLTAQVPTASAVGETSDPNWFDRTFSGEVKQDAYTNLSDIKRAGNIDEIASLEYEKALATENAPDYEIKEVDGNIFYYDKKDPTGGKWLKSPYGVKKGFGVISLEKARELGVQDPEKGIVGGGYYQYNEKTGEMKLTKGVTDKSETIDIDISTGTGEKFGTKEQVQLFNKSRVKSADLLDKTYKNIQGSENLLFQLQSGNFKTGVFAGIKSYLLSYGEELNILSSEQKEELIGLQSFGADNNQIVLSFIKTLGRNPTDLDLKFMIKTLASNDKTMEANGYILESRMIVDKATREQLLWEEEYIDNKAEGGRDGGGIIVGNDVFEIADFNRARREKRKLIAEETNKKLKEVRTKWLKVKDLKPGEDEKNNVISLEEVNATINPVKKVSPMQNGIMTNQAPPNIQMPNQITNNNQKPMQSNTLANQIYRLQVELAQAKDPIYRQRIQDNIDKLKLGYQ